jgi:carboxyl-terminal processing protease
VPKNQLIVSTRSNIEQYNTQFFTQKQPISEDIPLIVLINERSASASEIVAGALQDLDRAVVVGNRSFGKGLVQQPKPLPYGAQVKITISRYFIPSGRCIQALNYGQRLESGNAQRTKKEDYKAFKTKNGRTVFDGGGIKPDITINTIDKFDIITNLKNENLFFNFSNDYCTTHSITELENFELAPSVFEAFKTYCFAEGFSLNTNTEKHLKKAFDYSEEEDLNNISASLENIRKSLEIEKKLVFNQSKKRILWQLSEEIVKRNFYREGMYQYSLSKNTAIQEAKSILNDSPRYYSLLK